MTSSADVALFAGDPPSDRELIGISRATLIDGIRKMHGAGARILAERNAYLDNLTSTQERCTEILTRFRASSFVSAMFDKDAELLFRFVGLFSELAAAVVRARELHPEGCTLADLVAEVGEYARAELRETPAREREELIDVAVVALRLLLGERAR